ncbi:MAG: HesB/IscA family protein [Candidatus Puniceispirillaceae bacterium]
MFDPSKPLITLTDKAIAHVKKLMAKADGDAMGLRVGIKTAGCSGLQYVVEFATEKKPFEDVIEQDGVSIFIDPSAVMFLVGSEMDFVEDKFASQFVFHNPNESARCGCGESFSVEG